MNGHPLHTPEFEVPTGTVHSRDYLARIGVPEIEPATCPFDPGYDPLTFEGHLAQSSHLMETMKISMACWQVSNEKVTRWKVAASRHYGVPTVTGGGPFEVAVQQRQLPLYLDLVADIVPAGSEVATAATIRARGHGQSAEPDYLAAEDGTPNDPSFNLQWGLKNTGQKVNGTAGSAAADEQIVRAWTTTTGS